MTKHRKHSARATPATPEAYGATTAPAAPATHGGAPPAAPRAPAPGRWRRRLLIGIGLLLALRIALTLATPLIVRSALESAGLRGDYDNLSLSLLGGSVELTGVKLWPAQADAAAPVPTEAPLNLGLLRVSLGMLPLLGLNYVVEEVTVTGLRVEARRAPDGGLHIAGMPPRASETPLDTPPEPPSDSPAPLITIEQLALNDVQLAWTDESIQPPVATSLRLDLTGQDLQLGPGADTGRFEVALAAAGDCERLALLGNLRGDPDNLLLDARLELRGLRAGPLSGYLPPGVVDELSAGQADAKLAASWVIRPQGGRTAQFELSELSLRDAQGAPLLALDALRLNAPRLDAEAGVFELNDLVLIGLRSRARIDSSGTLHALGFALGAAPASTVASTPADGPAGTPAGAPASATHPPRVSLERLDLELAEFTLVDERKPGAAPLVAGLRLQNREPLRLLDAVPEELPPLQLLLTGRALPLAQQLRVELEAAPWASPATFTVGLDIRGLRGEGLTELQPELAAGLDGSGLKDGALSAELRVELDLRRRGPAQFDLSHGFAARLQVHDLALRDAPEGRPLLGLKGLELQAPRVDPAGGLVHVRALEIDTPQASLRRDAAGLHVAGLLLRAPAEGSAEDTAEAQAGAAAAEPDAPPADPPIRAALQGEAVVPTGPELRVDRFALHGLDLAWSDETTTPPCVIVFNALEVEVRRFTTRAFVEPKTIRFNLYLGAGEIELPRKSKASSLFAGVVSAAALAVTGAEDEPPTESRPAFGEVTLNGSLRLAPALTGNLRCNVAGLELLALAGPAAGAGIEIGDGLFDGKVTMDFRGTEGVDLESRFVFTDLSVSEPANGPIATYLKLPAPLDSVLFMLRNERGEHRVAFELSAPPEGVGGGRLAASAGEAIGAVVGKAVAAVPVRMLTSITDLVGVTGGEEAPPEPELALVFAPGSTALPEVSIKDLRNTLTKLRAEGGAVLALEHRLGMADLARADQLGNPSVEQCELHGAQLRQRRSELLRRQAESSAEARAMLLVGRTDEAESARARLIETEQQLCLTEAALDSVFERLRPGAERYREQRARAAALQIGQARLEVVQRALLALNLPAVKERIELRPPRLEPIEGEGGGTVLATIKGQ